MTKRGGESDRGSEDRSDRGGTGAVQEGPRVLPAADAFESAAAEQDEREGWAERGGCGEDPPGNPVGGVADGGYGGDDGPRGDLVLYLTSEAVVFMPNRFNRRRDIVSTRLPREQILGVDTVDRVVSLASPCNGGMRRRLRLSTSEEAHVFVINHPERVAEDLRSAVRVWPEPA